MCYGCYEERGKPVVINDHVKRDPDTRWPLGITLDPVAENLVRKYPEIGPCMSIGADYHP